MDLRTEWECSQFTTSYYSHIVNLLCWCILLIDKRNKNCGMHRTFRADCPDSIYIRYAKIKGILDFKFQILRSCLSQANLRRHCRLVTSQVTFAKSELPTEREASVGLHSRQRIRPANTAFWKKWYRYEMFWLTSHVFLFFLCHLPIPQHLNVFTYHEVSQL